MYLIRKPASFSEYQFTFQKVARDKGCFTLMNRREDFLTQHDYMGYLWIVLENKWIFANGIRDIYRVIHLSARDVLSPKVSCSLNFGKCTPDLLNIKSHQLRYSHTLDTS